MKRLKKAAALGAVILALAPCAVSAETRIQSDIAYRRELMAAMDWNLVRIAQTIRHQRPYDPARLGAQARALALLATLPWVAFVPGSDRGPTKADARIWQQPGAFQAAITHFEAVTRVLAKAAAQGPLAGVRRPLEGVAGACRSCHHRFMR